MKDGKITTSKGNIKQVDIISSKSYLHRYLIMCFLTKTKTTINNVVLSNDVIETINVLNSLGCSITYNDKNIFLDYDGVIKNELTINESGATLRMTLLLLINLLIEVTINIGEDLSKRPLTSFNNIFQDNDISIDRNKYSGKITGDYFEIDGSVSSQFISGLIFLCISMRQKSTIKINNRISSYNYILMTLEVVSQFNCEVSIDDNKIYIDSRFKKANNNISIEGDYSQAAFFICHSLINKNQLVINNLNEYSIQADKKIINILENNLNFEFINNSLEVDYKNNNAIQCNIDDCPDLGPILIVCSMFLKGISIITGINRLKYKESNRIVSSINILEKCNVKYKLSDDKIEIIGNNVEYDLPLINSYNDHRIALSLFILSLYNPVIIDGYESINKSYPNFIEVLNENDITVQKMS